MNNIIKSIGAGCLLSLSLTSCNDSFMERYPETSITDKVYFQTVKDLELYTNGLYGGLGASYNDVVSDNVMYVEDAGIFKMMRGETTPETVGQWSGWSTVRDINFMLEHVGTVQGDQPKIDHYVGLARMFRAIQYYGMVKSYSDLPWYSRTIQTTDEDL
ncbi:MAG: RagB/SusD family nutrient uptake outer membrane protein, partial [Tannerellaceae bacterium]